MQSALQLVLLEEVRDPEPPIRLSALFYEPGRPEQVAKELRSLGDVVVGVGTGAEPVAEALGLRVFEPEEAGDRLQSVPDGVYQDTPVFPTDPDRVFWALQGRRLPAKRHPYGMQLRIEELVGDRIVDEGGDLWHRRIEEIEAAAAAVCAHRFAVGHARWLGDPKEGVVVLPGSGPVHPFATEGVMPAVTRVPL